MTLNIIIVPENDTFVEPHPEDRISVFGLRLGAKQSTNIDQIDWYFRSRFPAYYAAWRKTGDEIEELLAEGWKMIGEYNGSMVAQLLPDRGGYRDEYNDPDNREIAFWMDDDFTRVWVFSKTKIDEV